MKVLVVNCGSSSIKYQLFEMPAKGLLAKGFVERIGTSQASFSHHGPQGTAERSVTAANHQQAMGVILDLLVGAAAGAGREGEPIGAVGHRVVHGGEEFSGSVRIDDKVLATIERMSQLAPLHNPPNLTGIRAAREALPGVPQIACFDTAFHATIPAVAYTYALPYELYERYGVRRYGFHGTSHRYVARRAAEILGRHKYDINCITCHLGNGSSITAVREGRSVDTSMGMTPLEGVPMGTRCGDIDPAILFYLAEQGYDFEALNELCNKKSGVLGISGCSNDMRTLVDEASGGNVRAQLAIDVFCYRIKKYVGAYYAALGNVDAVVFTGGIGENAALVRAKVCGGLAGLGIELDSELNEQFSGESGRLDRGGATAVLVIATDEEGAIAEDTYRLSAE